MKRINLRGLSEVLSEKELKNVLGGSGGAPGPDGNCECTHTWSGGDCKFWGVLLHANGQQVAYCQCGVSASHCLDLAAEFGDDWISYSFSCD